MRAIDRQSRLKRAKKLGRMAYDILRFEHICCVIGIEDEEAASETISERSQALSLRCSGPRRPRTSSREFRCAAWA